MRRICPNCMNSSRITAVLNEVRKPVLVAGCYCPECGYQWDEHYNQRTGERTNLNLKKSEIGKDQS